MRSSPGRSRSGHDSIIGSVGHGPPPVRWQDARHAWNQPHSGRGRHPRRPPRRHVVRHRPGPHDGQEEQRRDVRVDHHDRVHLHPARSRDLRRPGRRDGPRDHPERREHRPGDGVRRQPDRADRAGRREHAGRARRLHLLAHRRGAAPVRGPGRRPGLPVLPVRGARTPAGSTPPSSSRTSRRRTRSRSPRPSTGRSSPTRPARRRSRRRRVATTTRPSGASRRPSRCRPTSPRWWPASTTR